MKTIVKDITLRNDRSLQPTEVHIKWRLEITESGNKAAVNFVINEIVLYAKNVSTGILDDFHLSPDLCTVDAIKCCFNTDIAPKWVVIDSKTKKVLIKVI